MRFSLNHDTKVALAATITTLAVLAAGCGSMPSAPLTDSRARTETESAMVAAAPDDGAPAGDVGADAPGVATDPADVLAAFGSGGAMSVRATDLLHGISGTVRNGRWRIDVPSGAVADDARFSITVPSSKSPACQLEIVPASLNHFATPVRLTADCHGVAPKQLAGYVIFWFNPATQDWVEVPGSTVDLRKKTVSAPLDHFSVYSVGPAEGKSGW